MVTCDDLVDELQLHRVGDTLLVFHSLILSDGDFISFAIGHTVGAWKVCCFGARVVGLQRDDKRLPYSCRTNHHRYQRHNIPYIKQIYPRAVVS